MNIYVGNIPREATEDDLRKAFEAFGRVDTINIIKDKFTGEIRGFGFIEMPARSEAEAAISNMNGKEFKGRTLTVNEARPRTEKRGGNDRRRRTGGKRFR